MPTLKLGRSAANHSLPRDLELHPPDASNAGPHRYVFVSYSRRDQEFVRRVYSALADHGRKAWVDWRDVLPTARWREEIRAAIEGADAVVFVLSPDSVESDVCKEELDHAFALNKRFVPLLYRDVDPARLPDRVSAHNWIPWRAEDELDAAAERLLFALDLDVELVHRHTRLLVRAIEWEERGHDSSLLLRGGELEDAERWLGQIAAHPTVDATKLHGDFILASRRASTKAGRRRLAAVAAALVVALVLAGVAFVQRSEAVRAARVARSQELAATSLSLVSADPQESLVLAVKAVEAWDTPAAEDALREAMLESRLRATLSVKGDGLLDVAFSPDGQQMAVAGRDGLTTVWDPKSGRRSFFLRHNGQVNSVAYNSDGSRIVTSSDDGTAVVWDARDGNVISSFSADYGPIRAAAFSPTGDLAYGGQDKVIRLVDVGNGNKVRELVGHTDRINAIAYNTSGTRLASVADDGTARLWDPATGRSLLVISTDGGPLTTVAFSQDGKSLLTGGRDRTAVLWDAVSGKKLRTFTGHSGKVNSVAFSRDHQRIATGSSDGSVRVWDALTGEVLVTLSGHTDSVSKVLFSVDGNSVVTASVDGTVRVWDVITKGPLVLAAPGGVHLWDLDATRDDTRIVTVGDDARLRLWDAEKGQLIRVFPAKSDVVWTATFDHDATRIVTASESGDSGMVRIWDAQSGKVVWHREYGEPLRAASLDPGGTRVMTLSSRGAVVIRELSAKGTEGKVPLSSKGVTAAAFDGDGDRVVTANADHTATLWDAATGARIRTLTGHRGSVKSASFSADGQRVVTASADGTARIWDVATGRILQVLPGHRGRVQWAAFDSTGDRVVTGGDYGSVLVWDSVSGHQLGVFTTGSDAVTRVAYVGGEVAALSTDGAIHILSCDLCAPFHRLFPLARQRSVQAQAFRGVAF